MNQRFFIFAFFIAFIMMPLQYVQAQNGDGPIIIRDTEIEAILKSWSEPIIKAAGLQPDAINFILVQSPQINAFVAGGPNIFIFTGLIEKSESPGEIIGVIAHEIGHIRGGHLARTQDALNNASYESVIGTLLGIGAAVITGNGGLGTAIALGAQSTATGKFLGYSRVQESSADQAALTYMSDAHLNPHGLLTFMQTLEDQEILPTSQQTDYIRTHPLTYDRVQALKRGYETSKYKNKALPTQWNEDHARILAKLGGFISPSHIQWTYSDKDTSIAADYARAIAAYRTNKTDKAIKYIDALLKKEPNNIYFHELKGQILFENGQIEESLKSYSKAVSLAGAHDDIALIQISYAHALLESRNNQAANQSKAVSILQQAAKTETRSPRIHRLLATAYGKQGDTGMAKLHLAEEGLLKRNIPFAKEQANGALHLLDETSGGWLRAKDILHFIKQAKLDK